MQAKRIDDFLKLGKGAADLIPQAEQLLVLRHLSFEILPQNLRHLSHVANYKRGTVVMFAANNAAAARLRLFAPRLLDRFLAFGLNVSGLKVEVQPSVSATRAFPIKRAVLSPAAGVALQQLASELPESKLREAVRSLANKKSA